MRLATSRCRLIALVLPPMLPAEDVPVSSGAANGSKPSIGPVFEHLLEDALQDLRVERLDVMALAER